MDERVSFRLSKKSYPAYLALKQWCRVNRVPMGRMMNAVLQAMQGMPNYRQMGSPKHAVIEIPYPPQPSIDGQIRYRNRKDLTRVKIGNNGD